MGPPSPATEGDIRLALKALAAGLRVTPGTTGREFYSLTGLTFRGRRNACAKGPSSGCHPHCLDTVGQDDRRHF